MGDFVLHPTSVKLLPINTLSFVLLRLQPQPLLLRLLYTRTTTPLGGIRPVRSRPQVAPPAAPGPLDVLVRSNTAIHQRYAGKYFGSSVARHNSTPGDSPAVPACAGRCKSAPFFRPTREPSPPPRPLRRPPALPPSASPRPPLWCSTLILWQSIRNACCCCCPPCCPATFPTLPTSTLIRLLCFTFVTPRRFLLTHAFFPKHTPEHRNKARTWSFRQQKITTSYQKTEIATSFC